MNGSIQTILEKQRALRAPLDHYRETAKPIVEELPLEVRCLVQQIHADLFDTTLSVEVIKRRCGIRQNTANTRFRLFLGRSIRAYVEHHRLEAAQMLLRRTDAEVYLIGQAVGYEREETFYRAFRRHYDTTPAAYRAEVESESRSRRPEAPHRPLALALA